MEYFYHLKPKKMYGNILFPLSKIEEKYPKLFKEQMKMYEGREDLLNKEIKLLKCKWQDVLFLSCVNPKLIFAALELLGLLDEDIPEILKFPISVLKNENICSYQEIDNKEIFKKIDIKKYEEEKMVPADTLGYFVECTKKKEDPLIFSGVKHLLYDGELKLSDGVVEEYERLIG